MSHLRLQGLQKIIPTVFHDERGCFLESYRENLAATAGIHFVQDNTVVSKQGVVRGLHFQQHPGQTKLVYCSFGTIWDVAVDIRPDSLTYCQWFGVELNDQNHFQFFIPIGFAHGYCVLSDSACVHYKVSAEYDSATERTIRWDDPMIGVNWPIAHPILSERDLQGRAFKR